VIQLAVSGGHREPVVGTNDLRLNNNPSMHSAGSALTIALRTSTGKVFSQSFLGTTFCHELQNFESSRGICPFPQKFCFHGILLNSVLAGD